MVSEFLLFVAAAGFGVFGVSVAVLFLGTRFGGGPLTQQVTKPDLSVFDELQTELCVARDKAAKEAEEIGPVQQVEVAAEGDRDRRL